MTIPSPREQGIEALREGHLDQAIDLLARAVMVDGQDAGAQMFLGVAYSQKGLHAEAKRALQTAVEMRPQEARCYFNLGVALENAGDAAGAAAAYRQALQINPEQTQARARLQGLNEGAAAPDAGGPAAASGESIWAAPRPTGELSPETVRTAQPPGTVECGRCHQWSKPGLSCEWCSAPLQRSPAPATAPWLQPSYVTGSAIPAASAAVTRAPGMETGEAFGRRLGAVFIDGVLLYIIQEVLLLTLFRSIMPQPGQMPAPGAFLEVMLWSMLIGVATTCLYAGTLLAVRGQTLGKMALGLRVIDPEGGNPSFLRAALREVLGKWASGFVLGLGYFWMLWDAEQQTWHDKIAGTHVERA